MDKKKNKDFEPDISIIVPCYNVSQYIDRCVNSLLDQTLGKDRLEIILIDDSSTDSTREKILSWAEKEPVITALFNEKNLRQGGARNCGLDAASGRFIGFVDSDDWAEPEMYEAMLTAAYETNSDLINIESVHSFSFRFLSPEAIETGLPREIVEIKDDKDRADMIARGNVRIGAWNCLFKRELIWDNNIRFPENVVYEDIFWGAIVHLYFKKACLLHKRYYHYFSREDSTISSSDSPRHFEFFTMQKLLFNELKSRNAFFKYGDALSFDYLMNYYLVGMKLLSLRFSEFPAERFYDMRQDIYEHFPDWENNPYLKTNTKDFQKLLFELLKKDLTEDELSAVSETIRRFYGVTH